MSSFLQATLSDHLVKHQDTVLATDLLQPLCICKLCQAAVAERPRQASMHSLYVFDSSAQRAAKDWFAQIKASTEKEPLSQLFSMFKRETTVSLPKHSLQPHCSLCASVLCCQSHPICNHSFVMTSAGTRMHCRC